MNNLPFVRKIFCVVFLLVLMAALLPVRVIAQYTEADIRDYIVKYQYVAMDKMHEYRIPASITLAQGIFESACGMSRLATEGNNHFGIKCHEDWMGDTILVDDDELQECFRKYEDMAGSYNDHSKFLTTRKRYANLFQLDILDYRAWARTLKADGYATNPQYADRLISLIERFSIARLDTLCMKKEAGQEVAENPYGNGGKPVDNSSTNPSVTPTKPNQPVKPTTPDKPVVVPPAKTAIKVFTAIGSEYPAGASPFSYRKVFENNHTYFIIAQKGDTYEKIAGDVQVAAVSLRKFNDVLDPNSQPVENEIVYIESKAKTHNNKVHIVQAGETLRYIAQRYGVQLHYIFKYNSLDENSIIHPGDQILLKH